MEKQTALDTLTSLLDSGYECVPIWLCSFERADEALTLERLNRTQPWFANRVHVLVLEEDQAAYKANYPKVNIHPVHRSQLSPVGRAKQLVLDTAYHVFNHDRIIMMDDDLNEFNILTQSFTGWGKNVGAESSRGFTRQEREDFPLFYEGLFTLFSKVGEDACAHDPAVVQGSAIKRHMSFDYKNHRTKFTISGGVSPRQLIFFDLARLNKIGAEVDQRYFQRHGDDIGLVAAILQNGGKCFAAPSFIYDTYSEDVNIYKSKIRSAATKSELHAEERAGLECYDIRYYLREKMSIIDGTYEWGDVNWQKYAKHTGNKPVKVYWEPDGTAPQLKII